MTAQVIGTGMHIVWCYLLLFRWELDVTGLGIASFLTNLTMFFVITIYAHFVESIAESLFLPTAESFE